MYLRNNRTKLPKVTFIHAFYHITTKYNSSALLSRIASGCLEENISVSDTNQL